MQHERSAVTWRECQQRTQNRILVDDANRRIALCGALALAPGLVRFGPCRLVAKMVQGEMRRHAEEPRFRLIESTQLIEALPCAKKSLLCQIPRGLLIARHPPEVPNDLS